LALLCRLFDEGQRVGLVAEAEDEAAYLEKKKKFSPFALRFS
jgi:hypothetical protein